MTPTPIWQSPGLWGAIAAAIVLVQQLLGYAVMPNEQSVITGLLGQAAGVITSIIGVVGAVLALWKGVTTQQALAAAQKTLDDTRSQLRLAQAKIQAKGK